MPAAGGSRPLRASVKRRQVAADLEFEEAARLRDEIRRLEGAELGVVPRFHRTSARGPGHAAPAKPIRARGAHPYASTRPRGEEGGRKAYSIRLSSTVPDLPPTTL